MSRFFFVGGQRLSAGILSLSCLAFLVAPGALPADELGSASLQIAGSQLLVSPLTQTVPFDTPTLVSTSLLGYDPELGQLPANLKVVGELTGPDLPTAVQLRTVPNQPFDIPRLRMKGEYLLENIRLVQGDELIAYAEPRAVTIVATKLLISRVKARAMTADEIKSAGIVLPDDGSQAITMSFGFGVVGGNVIDMDLGIVIGGFDAKNDFEPPAVEMVLMPGHAPPRRPFHFVPPALQPFNLSLVGAPVVEVKKGGCDPRRPCRGQEMPPLPLVGAVVFPSEFNLLHQFFSVVLVVQNGAPEGDVLEVRDLNAKIKLPSGLRQAQTTPPTPLGVPVPLRIAGPDGELGTADDLTLLIAQAEAEAEFVVEGLREGTHRVEFDIGGTLHGLPIGPHPVSATAKGAVVVRDPTLGLDIARPDTVRAGQEFDLLLTLSNLGLAPVNALDLQFDTGGLAGVELVNPNNPVFTVGDLLPGEARTIAVPLRSRLTGRITSSSARTSAALRPTFSVAVQVGGLPLSADSFELPRDTKNLPMELRKPAVSLIGLAHSLAQAPAAVRRNHPPVTVADRNDRIYRLAQAGLHTQLGEELADSIAVLAVEWGGARDQAWAWDRLQRENVRGRELAAAIGAIWGAEVDTDSNGFDGNEANAWIERFGRVTHFLHPQAAILAGAGAHLEVHGRVNQLALSGFAEGAARQLPFAELYPLGGAEMAVVAEPQPGGYLARVRATASGYADLTLLLPTEDPGGAMTLLRWRNLLLPAGAVAEVVFEAGQTSVSLAIDEDADGEADAQLAPELDELEPRPFQALMARQNVEVDDSSHVADVLFSEDLAIDALISLDPERFRLPGITSNGGMTLVERSIAAGRMGQPGVANPLEGMANPRIVRVVFDNSFSPVDPQLMTIEDVRSARGPVLDHQEIEITMSPDASPGARVVGTVFDPQGQPIPYAEIFLYEHDAITTIINSVADTECVEHLTTRTRADANGHYVLPYVRQSPCGNQFRIEAFDPVRPYRGEAPDVVRYPGETQTVNVLMLGRGTVRGKVLYSDGTVPPGLDVYIQSTLFNETRRASVEPSGEYLANDVVVGPVMIRAFDELGNRAIQTIEMPVAGADVRRDLVLLRQPAAATGTVAGRVVLPGSLEPKPGAIVLLRLDATDFAARTVDENGEFEFGPIPTGTVELVAYHPSTGFKAGAKVSFSLAADQQEYRELIFRDDRGTIVGKVRKVAPNGVAAAEAGATVWIYGLPGHTVTAADGSYELPDIMAGQWKVMAASADRTLIVSADATLVGGETRTVDLTLRQETQLKGAIQGYVYGLDDSPVPNAMIHLAGDHMSTNWWHETYTDSNGFFRIDNVEPGAYGVHAIGGNSGAVGWAYVNYPGDTGNVTIYLREGVVRGRTVTLDSEGNEIGVQSMIQYLPVKIHMAWQLVVWPELPIRMDTNADGTFEIPALHGPMQLLAFNPFHGQKGPINVVVSDIPNEIKFIFDRNGAVRGTVFLEDGVTPAAGVELSLQGGQFENYIVTSAEDGHFLFELLPQGTYWITATSNEGGIFRKTRVATILPKHGSELDIQVVLPKTGLVSGVVRDANETPVPGAVVTLRESRFPNREMVQNSDSQGNFAFANVLQGPFTVAALSAQLGGLGGRIYGAVSFEGEEVNADVTLEGSAEIEGVVLSPESGEPVPNARLKLSNGFRVVEILGSDFEGRFRFERLPLMNYTLEAFDATTGRRGRLSGLTLSENNQVLAVELELEGRGVVDGHLYDPSAQQLGIPGASIQLYGGDITQVAVWSTTDADGYFEFGGIPEGEFDLYYRPSGWPRWAHGSGEIFEEDQRVTVDLWLAALAKLTGTIYQPRTAAGDSQTLAADVNSVVYSNGRVVAATTENPFVIDRIPPGRLTVETFEINGDHRVRTDLPLLAGEDKSFEASLRAIGSAEVVVRDANGAPMTGVDVQLSSRYRTMNGRGVATENPRGPFGVASHSGSTGAADRTRFEAVRDGLLQARVTNPVNGLTGSASGELFYEGEQVVIEVQMQPIGSITGTVYLADGVTPAAHALIAIKPDNLPWRILDADENGEFAAIDIPLRTYALEAAEHEGLGKYSTKGALSQNGEVDDYTIVLDELDPKLISIDPPNLSLGVPVSAAPSVRFSEPMAQCTGAACQTWLTLNAPSGMVPVQYVWSEGGRVVTFQHTSPLLSDTNYRIKVRDGLPDAAGRRLPLTVNSSFNTADVVPPKVMDVVPRANAKQVPLATSIQVTFSEPIVVESLNGHVALVNLQTQATSTLTALLSLSNRRVTLTDVNDLALDTTYELRIHGLEDLSGNVQVGTFTSRFTTLDTTPPTASFTSPAPAQSFVAGSEMILRMSAADQRGIASVTYTVGDWTRTLTSSTGPWEWKVPAPATASAGIQTLKAVVVDQNGNSTTVTREIYVEILPDAAPPEILGSCPADADYIVTGDFQTFVLDYRDDQKVESLSVYLNGVLQSSTLLNRQEGRHSFNWTPPATPPGQSMTVEYRLRDFAGKTTSRSLTLTAPTTPVLAHNTTLQPSSQPVFLASSFALNGSLTMASSVTLLQGGAINGNAASALTLGGNLTVQCGGTAKLGSLQAAEVKVEREGVLSAATWPLAVAASGTLTVEGGGTITADDKGYGCGQAPAGVATAGLYAGGSHGGQGAGSQPGEIFGSAMWPRMPGAGAGCPTPGGVGSGGGLIDLQAAVIVLDGDASASGSTSHAGAGGAIRVRAGVLSGRGTLRADGATGISKNGGGGRIALLVDDLASFDVASQVSTAGAVVGGGLRAGSGTVFVKEAGAIYGELWTTGTGELRSQHKTSLATIGQGTVGAVTAATESGDLWVEIAAGSPSFGVGVEGGYLRIGGTDYRIAEEGSDRRRVRLAGAAGQVTAGAAYRGVYHFDRITLRGGAYFQPQDLMAAGSVRLGTGTGISGDWSESVLEVEEGAELQLGATILGALTAKESGRVELAGALTLGGPLTLEADAELLLQDPAAAELTVAGPIVVGGGATLQAGTIEAPSVEVEAGARIGATGYPGLRLVAEHLTVAAGGVIDVEGAGFAGATNQNGSVGGAPPGVPGSDFAGGSHGGHGAMEPNGTVVGDVFDSVYWPAFGGGGGDVSLGGDYSLGDGGGTLLLEVGEILLDGTLSARGLDFTAVASRYQNPGAGGTVQVRAASLSGSGAIDASGGRVLSLGTCGGGSGGGGRVALRVDDLDFDPAGQVRAEGGYKRCAGVGAASLFASPGTVYWRTPGSTYGSLRIDAGANPVGGGDREVAPTVLPALGQGTVTSLSPVGDDDAWLKGAALGQVWHGVWVELKNAGGTVLGTYEALAYDAELGLRLAGAGPVSGAATFRGLYRFDEVAVVHGGSLQAADPVSGSTTVLSGEVEVNALVEAENLVIQSGARVRPISGGSLTFRVSGTLTVEAGATIDLNGRGYAPGYTHGGVLGGAGAAGSHGGRGAGNNASPVYDSLYRPRLPGSGGGSPYPAQAEPGGGVLVIEAGHLALEGQLLAKGAEALGRYAGAGGTIVVVVDRLSGGGTLDAGGGFAEVESNCSATDGGGAGGGRIRVEVAETIDFDIPAQARALGGDTNCPSSRKIGGSGSVYWKTPDSTWGEVLFDHGDRPLGSTTYLRTALLPTLGSGAPSALTSAGADLWLARSGGFTEAWHGVWVELTGASGSLGVFQAVDRDAAGRLRLAGAAGAAAATGYQGRYRFDNLYLRHGIGLEALEPIEGDYLEVGGTLGKLGAPLTAAEIVVKPGTFVPLTGSELALEASERLTIETGAVFDVSGKGYAGGAAGSGDGPGSAPPLVGTSLRAGASHGGLGTGVSSPVVTQAVGESYDSVYFPSRAGGGGGSFGSYPGMPGGGVVRFSAPELVFAGQILAKGQGTTGSGGGGAGGTVIFETGALSGTGTIDVSGGDNGYSLTCAPNGAGGAGRVAIHAATVAGFDPAAQIFARGGHDLCANGVHHDGGAGTIFVKKAADSYGELRLDAGPAGTPVVDSTPLPRIGHGWVGTATADTADPGDLWISPQDPAYLYSLGTVGMWVRIAGVDYRVIGENADRRHLLLDGAAAAVAVGQEYRGFYKFDKVTVRGKAKLEFLDFVAVGSYDVDGTATVITRDQEPPVLVSATPADGASFMSGQSIVVTVSATDNRGVDKVEMRVGTLAAVTDVAAPFIATFTAPEVGSATDVPLEIRLFDHDHEVLIERTLHIAPNADPTPPTAATVGCFDADRLVAPGVAETFTLNVADNERVSYVRLLVDGVEVDSELVDQVSANGVGLSWTVPSGATAGQVFALVLRVEDFAGRKFEIPAQATAALGALTGIQTLQTSLAGDVVLGAGTFTALGPLDLSSLELLQGATLTTAVGQSLEVTASGRLKVGCAAKIDITGKGYTGATSATTTGNVPAGLVGSKLAGGSHGGYGALTSGGAPVPGEVYGSLYRPSHFGGGGGTQDGVGSTGGGALHLTASEVVLHGSLVAQGAARIVTGQNGGGTGAGGSILVDTGSFSGQGKIDVTGGDASRSPSCNYTAGGGGGRVAIWTGTLTGFDIATQVLANGGREICGGTVTTTRLGGPGSVFMKTAAHSYGDLHVRPTNGTPSVASALPLLGSGSVTAFTADGADAWVQGAAAFGIQHPGSYLRLADSAGAEIGTFRVAAIDGAGKAKLTGAAAASAAAAWQGEYRFDKVFAEGKELELRSSPLQVSELKTGSAGLSTPEVHAPDDLSIKSGSVLLGYAGSLGLKVQVGGRLTVESGAKLDVSGRGYTGATSSTTAGNVPAGVLGAKVAGGSHGGIGALANLGTQVQGEVYGSVYRPHQAGGGGGTQDGVGSSGGGALHIVADELVLQGQLLAMGAHRVVSGSGGGTGAGGSILVETARLTGAGTIYAGGGDSSRSPSCNYTAGGGGGRVAIWAEELDGFDAATQVVVDGGREICGGTVTTTRLGGPGTTFLKTDAHTYGDLAVRSTNGTPSVASMLPLLGAGAVTTLTAQGGDGWLQAAAAIDARHLGAFLRLTDAAGAHLGTFRVLAIDGASKALLEGASAVSGAAAWQGEYRFDKISSGNRELELRTTPIELREISTDANGLSVSVLRSRGDLTIKANSLLTHPAGGSLLIDVAETLTVESGAKIDATGRGFTGGTSATTFAGAPAGTLGAKGAGGAHAGQGTTPSSGTFALGEIHDSVYRPALAGSGGGTQDATPAGAGGGVIHLVAGDLVLAGQIKAAGAPRVVTSGSGGASGAGGAILVEAGSLSGSGSLDASGGETTKASSCSYISASGGGRVALWIDDLGTFDPLAQVAVTGGRQLCGATLAKQAGAGTLLVKTAASTYGTLYVDNEMTAAVTPSGTGMAKIGLGAIGTVTVDTADATDLWIEPADANAKFDLGAVGMWVEVDGVDYKVIAENANRRKLLLDGAASAVTTGKIYRGRYKFDAILVKGRAQLEFRDQYTAGSTTVDTNAALTSLDSTAPSLSSVLPANGSSHVSGAAVTLSATATDNVAVVEVVFTLGSQSYTDSSAPFSWATTAPSVSSTTAVEMRVEARDAQYNWAREIRTLQVEPAGGAAAPAPDGLVGLPAGPEATAPAALPPTGKAGLTCLRQPAWTDGNLAAWQLWGGAEAEVAEGLLRVAGGASPSGIARPWQAAGDFRVEVELAAGGEAGAARPGLLLVGAEGELELRWQGQAGQPGRIEWLLRRNGVEERLASYAYRALPLHLVLERRGERIGAAISSDGRRLEAIGSGLSAGRFGEVLGLGLVGTEGGADFRQIELCRASPAGER